MLVAAEQCHPFAFLAAPDLREVERVRRRREQLEVLPEAEIVDRPGEGDTVQVDHDAAARAAGEVAGIDREAVRNVEHRGGDTAEPQSLLDPDRGPEVAAPSEGGARRTQGTGDDDAVTRPRTRSPWNALRAPHRGDVDHDL